MPKKRRKRKHHGDELLHPSDGWESRVETAEAYLLPTADQAEQMEWEALGPERPTVTLWPNTESRYEISGSPAVKRCGAFHTVPRRG